MKKTKNKHKFNKNNSTTIMHKPSVNFPQLSKTESIILESTKTFIIFQSSTIKKLTNLSSITITNTLHQLKNKQVITHIYKNKYTLTKNIKENIYKIATELTSPSYISFWTAASLKGLTTQQLQTIQLVSTKQHKPIKINNFTIETTTYKKENFTNYHLENNIEIAQEEKLIIDLLFKPEQSGGTKEITNIITELWSKINQRLLLNQIKSFNNKSIAARLGYIIEKNNLPERKTLIKKLQKFLPKSYIKLNPGRKRTNEYNKKWRIIVNDN